MEYGQNNNNKKEVLPDNVGVILKRDDNTSASDKERHDDEFSLFFNP